MSIKAALLLFVALVFFSCSDEEQKPSEKEIPFTFNFSAATFGSSGGRTSGLDDISAALITLTNSAGDQVVLNKKQVNIYQYGDNFVTEAVPLKPARYVITEFMLIDDEQNVIYATPVKGSKFASHVDQPLPIGFVVSKTSVKEVGMQVASTEGHAPSDFGYAAFGIDLMMTFQLSAVLADSNAVKLTNAGVVILEANKPRYTDEYVVHTQQITPSSNLVRFSGDDDKLYTLLVSKMGYGTYSRNFTYNELKEELDGKPMVVTFTPAFDIRMQPYFYSDFHVAFTIGSTDDVTVDWGDGTRETGRGRFTHTYIDDAYYPVTVTGGLQNIYKFESGNYEGLIAGLDTRPLVNLRELVFIGTEVLAYLDLSANGNLRTLHLESTYTNGFTLPESHSINRVILDDSFLQDGELDIIIESVHGNAYFKDEMRNGTFSFLKDNDGMIQQPSPASMELLKSLKSFFNWTIRPDVVVDEEPE